MSRTLDAHATGGIAAAPGAGDPAARIDDAGARAPRADWPLAIGLSVALGLVFRLTAGGMRFPPTLPAYAWAPATGVAILSYLGFARVRPRGSLAPATSSAATPASAC